MGLILRWLSRALEDLLLVIGVIGASVAVGGLWRPLGGLLLLSLCAVAGGALLGRSSRGGAQ